MRKLFLAILIAFSATTFAQTPSVSALSFSLDNYGLYNNWHNQSDTFFVVPIRMDSFFSRMASVFISSLDIWEVNPAISVNITAASLRSILAIRILSFPTPLLLPLV